MSVSAKKSLWAALLLISCSLFFGCQKKPSTSLCKTDEDCRAETMGRDINSVCYMGKCEECVEDSDCVGLQQCVKNRCTKKCEANSDCGENSHCEDNFCVANCKDNHSCPDGQICHNGACIHKASAGLSSVSKTCSGLENIHFAFDKYDISSADQEHLNNLAECLENNPGTIITIEGHADEQGTPSYNLTLSERRANAVKNYLVQRKGIASMRLTTVPYGDQKPLLDERNEYAYQKNRRAQFVLKENH